MATSKPTLSREYVFVPVTISTLGYDVDDLVVKSLAFMTAGAEPVDADWEDAIIAGSADPQYNASIGEALVLLLGPTRGDAVTTLDLPDGDYQVWVDAAIAASDERIVRVAGTITISQNG